MFIIVIIITYMQKDKRTKKYVPYIDYGVNTDTGRSIILPVLPVEEAESENMIKYERSIGEYVLV